MPLICVASTLTEGDCHSGSHSVITGADSTWVMCRDYRPAPGASLSAVNVAREQTTRPNPTRPNPTEPGRTSTASERAGQRSPICTRQLDTQPLGDCRRDVDGADVAKAHARLHAAAPRQEQGAHGGVGI